MRGKYNLRPRKNARNVRGYNIRPRKKARNVRRYDLRFRPGSYQVSKNCEHKQKVNTKLATFMKSVKTKIILLDNVEMLSSRALLRKKILPRQLTVVEYDEDVFALMHLRGVKIVNGAIEDYISSAECQSIGGAYFDFTGNHISLGMFDKSIHAMTRHKTPDRLRIALTFSLGRKGKFDEPELHDACMDMMRSAFPGSSVERVWYYIYKRYRGMKMCHYQFIIHK